MAIEIAPTGRATSIAIDKDIIGKKTFTSHGKAFRSGMIVKSQAPNAPA